MRARRPDGSARKRRGVVLILILAMLGLLALIGVTFATFSGQAKLGADYAARAVSNVSADQYIDFALDQLINDTNNPKSAIRGHSLLRDMYGRDFFTDPIDGRVKAYQNHLLRGLPEPSGQPLTVTNVTQAPTSANPQLPYIIVTNIPTENNAAIRQLPALYGANLTGNVLRLQQWVLDATNARYTPLRQIQRSDRLAQTFEVVADNRGGNYHVLTLSFADRATTATTYNGDTSTTSAFVQPDSPAPTGYPIPGGTVVANIFEIDGRYMRAFNGTGLGASVAVDDIGVNRPYSAFGNFLYNRLNVNNYPSGINDPNLPAASLALSTMPAQMDEDYDAADNENWFLALRSADGQVLIPSFHRPGNIVYNPSNTTGENDWTSSTLSAHSKFLRPRKVDHPFSGDSFPDLTPDANGRISKYEIDNDGDSVPDSVWVDLGYPVKTDPSGKKFKPLFSFMVLGLNGRLPLNTAGNLNKRSVTPQTFANVKVWNNSTGTYDTYPTYVLPAGAYPRTQNGDGTLSVVPNHASHIGYSQNEINPEYAMSLAANTAPLGGRRYLRVLLQGNPLTDPAPAVEGRWGEVGVIAATRNLSADRQLFPRAGRSYWPNNLSRKFDEFDTSFDALDFSPKEDLLGPEKRDLFDPAYRPLLASERLRRFVLPVDLSGNGRMVPYGQSYLLDLDYGYGFDAQGRIGYHLYYRPPGIPSSTRTGPWDGVVAAPTLADDGVDPTAYASNFLNKLHGYEAQRNPDGGNRNLMAGMPSDVIDPTTMLPGMSMPSFTGLINSSDPAFDPTTGAITTAQNVGMLVDGSLALSDAAQMNLYDRQSYDAPFGLADQEYLDRAGDVDDSGLAIRIPTLLPDLFDSNVNTTDAAKKRRLFTFETWDLGVAVAPIASMTPSVLPANYYPFGTPNNYTTLSDGVTPLQYANVSTIPALAHGGRRFNLNLPLPASNRSDEPVRQKYVRELYQLMKSVIAPPDGASLTALQLASIGQFAVNVVDFRDPDATMTRFDNYDITYQVPTTAQIEEATAHAMGPRDNAAPITVTTMAQSVTKPTGANSFPVAQWGMEYNPIAFSEILGYTFTRRDQTTGTNTVTPRLFVELVNTLTEDRGTTGNGVAADLNLDGWGFVITQDDPTQPQPDASDMTTARVERPNVATGQISQDTIDRFFVPLAGTGMGSVKIAGVDNPTHAMPMPLAGSGVRAIDQMAGNPTVHYYTMSNYINGANPETPATGNTPAMETSLAGAPITGFTIDAKINDELVNQIPLAATSTPRVTASQYYWIHVLRPANPNAGIDAVAANPSDPMAAANALAAEPKVVVDSFRFPYFVATGTIGTPDNQGNILVTPDANAIYSVKRRQPYRGGHFVPRTDNVNTPPPVPANPNPYLNNVANAYGYTEQTFPSTQGGTPITLEGNYVAPVGGVVTAQRITGPIFHSLDQAGNIENWDHFPFHDRDFQSVAELLLVPSCPPGLFTKQFVELGDPTAFAPSATPPGDLPPPSADSPTVPYTKYYYTPPFQAATPPTSPVYSSAPASDWGGTVRGVRGIPDPPAFPYLAEAFYYTSGSKSGWYKLLEFLEVPSNHLGYIGPVAAGQNADWARRDLRPGIMNLNLITDEEAFFGLIDDYRLNSANVTASAPNFVQPTVTSTNPVGVFGVPHMATAIYNTGLPSFSAPVNSNGFNNGLGTGMKWAFADFLKLRDGGSGLVYSPFSASAQLWGNGPTPANRISLPSKPFRSLAAADINDTILRPSRLAAFQALNHPAMALSPTDPGYFDMAAYPPGLTTPRNPPLRLFSIPDADPNVIFTSGSREDLSSETNTGNYVLSPNRTAVPPPPPQDHTFLSNTDASLFVNTSNSGTPPYGYLGGSTTMSVADHRWHPAFRNEMLSKVMNHSTVRTHQFAVWMTVGFFEVVKEGNPQMADVRYPSNDPNYPNLSVGMDQLGPELNAAAGKATRYRSYFIIDRSRATGFNPSEPGDFRDLVVFRRRIE